MSKMDKPKQKRRIGFIGYGKVAAFLIQKVLDQGNSVGVELAFVCDLFAPDIVINSADIPEECKARDLSDFEKFKADLIVEAAHPNVSKEYGARILNSADYMIASTTTFADSYTENLLNDAADNNKYGHGIYLASGALWGALDIQKMSDGGKLASLQVTMKKHPDSLYPVEGTNSYHLNEQAKTLSEEVVLWDGPVRELCSIFPRNVNTIATAAICARNTLGMSNTQAVLIADSRLDEMIIEVKAQGPQTAAGKPGLRLTVLRENPSVRGEVTGPATLNSFYSSLLKIVTSSPRGNGVHLA